MAVGLCAMTLAACGNTGTPGALPQTPSVAPTPVVTSAPKPTPTPTKTATAQQPHLKAAPGVLNASACTAMTSLATDGAPSSAKAVLTTGAAINALKIPDHANPDNDVKSPAPLQLPGASKVVVVQVNGDFESKANSAGGDVIAQWPPETYSSIVFFFDSDYTPLTQKAKDGRAYGVTQYATSIANLGQLGTVKSFGVEDCDILNN